MATLVKNEELQLLQDSARRFIQNESPVSSLRSLRDERSEEGFSKAVWSGMVDLGWVALTIPEEYGGMGYDHAGWGPILEEMGRALVSSPFLSTAVFGSTMVKLAGSATQKDEILPQIAEGNLLIALALEEGNVHAPEQISMYAVQTEGGYSLSGQKNFVLDGHVADKLVVPVRTSGEPGEERGISLFLVDAAAEDLDIERTMMVDSRNAATATFNEVVVPVSALLGELDEGFPILERVLDIGRIALSAEMLGLAQEAFERTVAYLKTRKQFGQHIGSFQALQHRAAHMFCELELCKSVIIKALIAIDEDDPDLPALASLAKYTLGETTKLITREAIQMFGGIGMTDEEEIGFFLKRAIVAEQTLGSDRYHLDRFARLRGY